MEARNCLSAAGALSLALVALSLAAGPPASAAPPPPPDSHRIRSPIEETGSGGDSRVPGLDRRDLVDRVLERNPEIAASRSAWRAALERVPQARSLSDPKASYSVAPLALDSSDARFGQVVRLGQAIPFPGTLALREQVASAESAAAESRLREVRLRLATMAALLWDDYWLVERALEINREHRALLESFRRVATDRYAAGLVPQQAPLEAEVEGAHLLHEEARLDTRRRVLRARINALLHRAPDEPMPPPVRELPVPVQEPGTRLDLESLVSAALETRPELRARAVEVDARKASLELERLEGKPDFEAVTSYSSLWSTSEHRWLVGIGVKIPFWRKRIRAGIAQAEAELESVRAELEGTVDRIRQEVATALARLREARHVVALYDDRILPASRDQIRAARAGFETGANGMLALIDAERSLRTAELRHLEARAGVVSRRAELERALGRFPGTLEGTGSDSDLSTEDRR